MKYTLCTIFILLLSFDSYSKDDDSKNRALNSQDLNRLFFNDMRKQRKEMDRLMNKMQKQLFYGGNSFSQEMQVHYKETAKGLDMIIPLANPQEDRVNVEIKGRVITLTIVKKSKRGSSTTQQSFAIPARINPESPSFKQEKNNFIISFRKYPKS